MNSAAPKTDAAVSLADLLSLGVSAVSRPSASQAKILEQLSHLRERLATERFQLAVLGQFKRGKSTLLNALLRADVLPTGVVPVTAIPAFIQPAPRFGLRVGYTAGRTEEVEMETPEALRERLTELVTEERNPHNRLGIARVDVLLPSRLLERGVVLIDTPGVGSTFRHNTDAADAILPECDATLFVVSADPPITEVEIEYLARIRKTVARLIIVLNKVDTLESDERETAAAFLRRVLAEQANVNGESPVFCVSARRALSAQKTDDAAEAEASGLPELEAHLTQFLANEKSATLHAAIARKASALVGDLQLETEISLRALHLPLQDLERRLAAFDEAAKQFEVERRAASDLLTGDRLRAFQELEADAEALRVQGRNFIRGKVEEVLARSDDAEVARAFLTEAITEFFDTALQETVRRVGERVGATFAIHQGRADKLITLVRQTAADLLEIPFRAPESKDAFEAKRDPFWITAARSVALSPFPPGALDRFLPAALRRRRLRARLLEEIEVVLRRNVENLRWATRQNLGDSFRRFGAELDERLALSLDATRGAMQAALGRRIQHTEAVEAEIAEKQKTSLALAGIGEAIARKRVSL
jgi:predicted GTPase